MFRMLSNMLQIVVAVFTNDASKVRNARSVRERQRRDTPVSYSILLFYVNILQSTVFQSI